MISRRHIPASDAPGSELAALLEKLASVAMTQRPVLLVAPRQSAPLLLAEALHHASLASKGNFVPVRCGLAPAATVDTTLFGSHRRGYPGRETGGLVAADGGTLYIDQVQLASPQVQEALLRILEEQEIALGQIIRRVDIRLVVSAPLNIEKYVTAGRLRHDLFVRFHATPVPLPKHLLLKEALLQHVEKLRQTCTASGSATMVVSPVPNMPAVPEPHGGFSSADLHRAAQNVFEMYGSTHRPEDTLFALVKSLRLPVPELIARKQLEAVALRAASHCVFNYRSLGPRLYDMLLIEMQRALIRRALEECNGVLTNAASLLGLTLQELESRLDDLGLGPPSHAFI